MAYVTAQEYVNARGERETALLTNDQTAQSTVGGPMAFNSATVDNALSNASDVVDGYIGVRYSIPLQTVPQLVKGWTIALAREELAQGTGRSNQTIKDAADIVRAQLLLLSTNKLNLPIATATPPSINSPGAPLVSGDRARQIFTAPGALDDYTATFTGATPVPAWRYPTD